MYIFTSDWWRYVLDDDGANPEYGADWLPGWSYWWLMERMPRVFWCAGYLGRTLCRWRGHPAGVWFYNIGGLEPDMRCKGCGTDLG